MIIENKAEKKSRLQENMNKKKEEIIRISTNSNKENTIKPKIRLIQLKKVYLIAKNCKIIPL